ncbi:MAG: hypothetical protein ACI8TP_004996 [Acidimicrobiales bacterium]|jgi:hypothetical protein
MFGRAKSFEDPQLGAFAFTRRAWRGRLRLEPHGSISLTVPGSRSGPDEVALALARTIPVEYERCRAAITTALDEHRVAALQDHDSAGHDAELGPASAAVIELGRLLTIQLVCRVGWDDDHSLGACLRDGALVELNGSILEP